MSEERPNIIAAKVEAKKYVADRPDVLGVGVGDKCIRIYLKDEEGRLGIPDSFLGFPVEFVETGVIKALRVKHEIIGNEVFERLNTLSREDYEAAVATVRKLARGEEVSDGELADALSDMSSRLDIANALLPLCTEMVERFMRHAGIKETPRGLTLEMLEEARRDAEERHPSKTSDSE